VKNKRILIWIGVVTALVLIASTVYLFCREETTQTTGQTIVQKDDDPETDKPKKKFTITNRMAIVIDDIGYDLSPLNEILLMDIPITIAILPYCQHSKEAAERAMRKGKEILLHLPMEPHGYPEKDPGVGTLFLGMKNEEILNQLEKDIDAVPYISGVNNHMGSRFMENEEKVEIVFNCLKRKNLFFLDSLTTKKSKGRQIAKKIGERYVSRDVFIDNDHDFGETYERLIQIIEAKDRWRSIIVTGHPYMSTIQAIREALPLFEDKGITIVPLSDLVE
jgi:polysaccharide deacetylase 2 family uncharacterized protein YibQ